VRPYLQKKAITKKGWWSCSSSRAPASKHEALSSNFIFSAYLSAFSLLSSTDKRYQHILEGSRQMEES
jgi:hypothetical protein